MSHLVFDNLHNPLVRKRGRIDIIDHSALRFTKLAIGVLSPWLADGRGSSPYFDDEGLVKDLVQHQLPIVMGQPADSEQ